MAKTLTHETFVVNEIQNALRLFNKIDITNAIDSADSWKLAGNIEDKVLCMQRIAKAANMFIETYQNVAENMKARAKEEAAA